MGTSFRRVGGGVALTLGAEESLIVGILIEQLLEMLGQRAEETGQSAPGGDSAGGDFAGGDPAGGDPAGGGHGDRDAEGPGAGDLPDLGITEDAETPDDPVLARLFPDGYREDPEAAREFRRYTEATLRDGKREAAEVVLASLRGTPPGTEMVLDKEQAQCWLRALNDVRLALGTRLEITDDAYDGPPSGLDPDDPVFALFAAYDWLTALQDQLVRVLW